MENNPKASEEHSLSEKQTNTEEHKGKTTIAAVLDPSFPLPELTEKSGPIRYILSFGTLFLMIGVGIAASMVLGVEIMQTSQPFVVGGLLFATLVGALFVTGTVWVDWFELVVGYWWLSMPIGALAGLLVVLNIEASATMAETD